MDGYFSYYRRPKLSDKNYAVISTIVFLFLKDQVSLNYFTVGFPMPESMLEPYNLVQRKCIDNTKVYKAVLIYRKDYTFDELVNAEETPKKKKNDSQITLFIDDEPSVDEGGKFIQEYKCHYRLLGKSDKAV